MLGEDRYHLTGISNEMLARYGVYDPLGQKLRAAEADRLLQCMDQCEVEVAARERESEQITDRINRMNTVHRLQMDYLISFGVRAEHRDALRQVLHETKEHCRLSLKEAIQLANGRTRFPDQSSNGSVEGDLVGVAGS
ncbi:MAG: hypothetical protein KDD44_14280 [Bdellovibrionales bacterium]|nr:hypothetical protein [Bdellovibrionales bacterium]